MPLALSACAQEPGRPLHCAHEMLSQHEREVRERPLGPVREPALVSGPELPHCDWRGDTKGPAALLFVTDSLAVCWVMVGREPASVDFSLVK